MCSVSYVNHVEPKNGLNLRIDYFFKFLQGVDAIKNMACLLELSYN